MKNAYYVLYEQGLIKARILAFMEMVENEGVINVLKGLNVSNTRKVMMKIIPQIIHVIKYLY